MSRLLLAATLLVATATMAACSQAHTAQPDTSSVGKAFDNPPVYPGYQWARQGHPVNPEELGATAGPPHCGWQSATILTVGWPLGTVSANAGEARIYLRDPNGVIGGIYQAGFMRSARLPSDARPTGYKLGSIELYLSPTDQDQAAYLVAPGGAERWPRAAWSFGCI